MKNILVDLIDTQGTFKGSGVYIRKVFLALLSCIVSKKRYSDVNLICVYDSSKSMLYPDFSIEILSNNPRITMVDINNNTFSNICKRYSVNTVFLGYGQQLYYYDFSGVNCRVICVLHDIFDLEFSINKFDKYLRMFKSDNSLIKSIARKIHYCINDIYDDLKAKRIDHAYNNHIKFFQTNSNYIIITVSSYSYFSIQNLLPFPKEKIKILWSPEKEITIADSIESKGLKDIIDSGIKYLLIVSADRSSKNAKKAIDAFVQYANNNPDKDLFILSVGYEKSIHKKHFVLPYLSDTDIEYAYKNCYALIYPSYFEGFGYPPIEAMRYRKPVLSSNVCSMPEILQDAPIWFSPFYITDIYKAISTLLASNYMELCERSYRRYLEIRKKQREDLDLLLNYILM